jgi:hypothetical protein
MGAFCLLWANFELHSTVFSAVPGPMSSYTLQCFLLYQIKCRVTLDSASCCTRSNVELHSTVLFVLPGPMSNSSRLVILQCFSFFPLSFYLFIAALNLENFRLFGELIWNRLSKCIRMILTVRCYDHTSILVILQ